MTVAELELHREAVKPKAKPKPKVEKFPLVVGQAYQGQDGENTYLGKDKDGMHWFVSGDFCFTYGADVFTAKMLEDKLRKDILDSTPDQIKRYLSEWVGDDAIQRAFDDNDADDFKEYWREVNWKDLTPAQQEEALDSIMDDDWTKENMTEFDTLWLDESQERYEKNEHDATENYYNDSQFRFDMWWEDVTNETGCGGLEYHKEWLQDIIDGEIEGRGLNEASGYGDLIEIVTDEVFMYPTNSGDGNESIGEVIDNLGDQFVRQIFPRVLQFLPEAKAIYDEAKGIIFSGFEEDEIRRMAESRWVEDDKYRDMVDILLKERFGKQDGIKQEGSLFKISDEQMYLPSMEPKDNRQKEQWEAFDETQWLATQPEYQQYLEEVKAQYQPHEYSWFINKMIGEERVEEDILSDILWRYCGDSPDVVNPNGGYALNAGTDLYDHFVTKATDSDALQELMNGYASHFKVFIANRYNFDDVKEKGDCVVGGNCMGYDEEGTLELDGNSEDYLSEDNCKRARFAYEFYFKEDSGSRRWDNVSLGSSAHIDAYIYISIQDLVEILTGMEDKEAVSQILNDLQDEYFDGMEELLSALGVEFIYHKNIGVFLEELRPWVHELIITGLDEDEVREQVANKLNNIIVAKNVKSKVDIFIDKIISEYGLTEAEKKEGIVKQAWETPATRTFVIDTAFWNKRSVEKGKWAVDYDGNMFKLYHYDTLILEINQTEKTVDFHSQYNSMSDNGGRYRALWRFNAGSKTEMGWVPAEGWKDANPDRQREIEVIREAQGEVPYIVAEKMSYKQMKEYLREKYARHFNQYMLKYLIRDVFYKVKQHDIDRMAGDLQTFDFKNLPANIYAILQAKYPMLRLNVIISEVEQVMDGAVRIQSRLTVNDVIRDVVKKMSEQGLSYKESIDSLVNNSATQFEKDVVIDTFNAMDEGMIINFVEKLVNAFMAIGAEFDELLIILASVEPVGRGRDMDEWKQELRDSCEEGQWDTLSKGINSILMKFFPKETTEMLKQNASLI